MPQERILLGLALMLGFCALAPLGDSLAKLLGGLVPLADLVLLRFVAQVVLALPIVLLSGQSLRLPRRVLALCALRTLLHVAGIAAMFSALRFLPVADAVAIAYVMPFIILFLGRYVLGEAVGPHRLAACAVGFVGTLLVVQPNFAAVGAPALLPLAVAVIFALFMMVTRQIARDADAIVLQAVGGLIAVPVVLPWVLVDGHAFPALDGAGWAMVVALGVTGTLGHLFMTWSLRFAPAATVAPMQYLEIPVATFYGLAIFGELPNGLAALGIAVTMGAGLYILARERRLSRAGAPIPPTPRARPPSAG
jgi:drug/metabolite transporter (DMT)-like permease